MDELYDNSNDDKPKINLEPQPYNADPYMQLNELKKKHGTPVLAKFINEAYTDDQRRKQAILNRLKNKKINL